MIYVTWLELALCVIKLLKLAGVLQNYLSLALSVAASLNNVEVKFIPNFALRGTRKKE